jgi:hemerythrin-like metal-binding protein
MPLKIEWDESFSVGHALLDDQHKELLALLQRAADCVEDDSPNGRALFHGVLNDVCAYTTSHFRTEETLLAQCHYPLLAEHKAEHFAFLEQITELTFAASQGVTLKADLQRALLRWLSQHILEADRQYSHCLENAVPVGVSKSLPGDPRG